MVTVLLPCVPASMEGGGEKVEDAFSAFFEKLMVEFSVQHFFNSCTGSILSFLL